MATHYNQPGILGYQGGMQVATAEIVNVKDDPEKSGRARIRLIGHHADLIRIPDDQLPWARVMTGTIGAGLSGAGVGTTGLLPGSRVKVLVEGNNDYTIIGVVQGEQDVHPMIKGHENTDLGAPQDRDHGWNNQNASEVTTTQEERNQKRRRGKSKVDQGQKEAKSISGRTAAKDLGSNFLSIGRNNVFDNTQDAQQYIQNKIQNKASVMPQGLQMIQQLKQIGGANPTAIQGVGAGNLMSVMQSLQKLFGGQKKKKKQQQPEEQKRQEELLKKIEEEMMNEESQVS